MYVAWTLFLCKCSPFEFSLADRIYACLAARAFVGVTRYLLQQEGVEFILSERFNQDPLESHFGNQRQMRGGNEAPSTYQFNTNVNALRLRSSQTIKVIGGNTRHSNLDLAIDNTPMPHRVNRKGFRLWTLSLETHGIESPTCAVINWCKDYWS